MGDLNPLDNISKAADALTSFVVSLKVPFQRILADLQRTNKTIGSHMDGPGGIPQKIHSTIEDVHGVVKEAKPLLAEGKGLLAEGKPVVGSIGEIATDLNEGRKVEFAIPRENLPPFKIQVRIVPETETEE
jgi:hypothetical protein